MNTLNKKIREIELEIIKRKYKESDMKKEIDLAKLNIKSALDSKDKNFSNDEKRDAFAESEPSIKSALEDLRKHRYETELLEIELQYMKRELEILLVYMTKDLEIEEWNLKETNTTDNS